MVGEPGGNETITLKFKSTITGNSRVFLALVHHPVYNRNSQVIATSITNLDLHDIARIAATYNIERYFVVHPLSVQQQLATEIINYWQQGAGAGYNQDRRKAFECLQLAVSLEAVIEHITSTYGRKPLTVVTDARVHPNTTSYQLLRQRLTETSENYLLIFGTGWGLEKSLIEQADYVLEPIFGRGDYNHLSVRSAVAIIVDRLLGENWWANHCNHNLNMI
jgi:hypothetical protein